MRGYSPGTRELDHASAFRLVPWLANGTLEGAELVGLLDHLKVCRECREELRFLPELRWALEVTEVPPPERSLARLLARIDAEERAPRPLGECLHTGLERWLGGAPHWLRGAFAAQTLALAVLAAVLLWPRPAAPPEVFRTLSTPPAATASAGARLRLVLAAGTSIEQLRALLDGDEAQIVGGPSAVGALTIELAPTVGLEDGLARLRAARAVLLAEPVAAAVSKPSPSP